jgi:hypothetical protein
LWGAGSELGRPEVRVAGNVICTPIAKKTLIRIVSCNTLTLEMSYLKGELLNGDIHMT